jgi:DNA polymerase (family 10)
VKDVDVLVSCDGDPAPIMDRFVSLPGVVTVTGQGSTKSSIILRKVMPSGASITMNADLRVVRDEQYPFALHYFSGSKEHCIAMRQRAIAQGMKLNEYALAGESKTVAAKDEAELFAGMGLAYIPPELREDTGEMAAAEQGKLPRLIEAKDIQGLFHNHTIYSDGGNTVEEMALAAKALGLKYLGFGDHSQSLNIANGMPPERLMQQLDEIDALNKRLKGIVLFKGSEVDVLEDGSLDYDDKVLARLDYVVASVHTHFGMSRMEMTDRILHAMKHPRVTMLGHLTGRLLLKRDAYAVDVEAVLQAAAERGVMIEINADPHRLDLDWVHCKRAKALGVKLVINPDAHSTGGLANFRFGVDVARRGWLEKGDVFNTRSAAEVARAFAERKKAAGL